MQKKRSSSSTKTKQDTAASVVAAEPTKEGQLQRRNSSSRAKHSAQANGSLEKLTNSTVENKIPSNDEKNKLATNNENKGDKENWMLEEDKSPQQNDEKSSELTGSQAESTEMT